jgi:hypothetical protein
MTDQALPEVDAALVRCSWCGSGVAADALQCRVCQTPTGAGLAARAHSRRTLAEIAIVALCGASALRLILGLWSAFVVHRLVGFVPRTIGSAVSIQSWTSVLVGAIGQAALLLGAAAALSLLRRSQSRLP